MSSLKDLASLIMVPSLYKDGELHTVKPLGNSILHPDATGNHDGTDGSTPAEGNFTFSRGSNLAATRVDVNGLIEKGRENLVPQSNTFSGWANSNASVTSGQGGYDGTNDAWKIEAILNTSSQINKSAAYSGVHTFSVYAKAGTTNWIRLNLSGVGNAYFDLANGVVGSISGVEKNTIESVGNGWYRCSIFGNGSSTAPFIFLAAADNDVNVSAGDNVYIQDAQVEAGLVATDYIETGASTAQAGILEDMPRLDYSGSCPALLLEPQRTNILAYSEGMFDSSYFYPINGISVEGQQTDLNGTNTAVKLSNFIAGASRLDYNTAVAAVDGKTYTYSAYYKGSGNININVSTSTGVGGAGEKTITLTNEWVRHSITVTFSNPTGNVKSHLAITRTANNDAEVYLCFAQIEEGSYPTSYIPTYGSSVTRSADYVQQLTMRPDNLSGSAFTYFLDMNVNTSVAAFSGYFNEVDSTGAYKAGFVWSNGLQWRTPVGGGNYYVTLDSVIATGDRAKMLVAVDGTERRVYYNGSLVITIPNCDNNGADTDGIVPYYGSANVNFYSGLYNQLVVFDTALTDSECIALTTL